MREAHSVDRVALGPDVVAGGAEAGVDLHEAALIELHAAPVQGDVVAGRPPS
jgi:hypothetical protein